MSRNEQLDHLARALFAKKRQRRRELAALPVEEKFAILLRLQQLASEVAQAAGRTVRTPWKGSER